MFSTSLGRPPGFIAIALTNSGETQRTGERTGTSGDGPSSEPFCCWPSLVMRRRGRVVGSSRDMARAWTPVMIANVIGQPWLIPAALLSAFYHCHQMLIVSSHCECSLHRPLCAFSRQSNWQSTWRRPQIWHAHSQVNGTLANLQNKALKPHIYTNLIKMFHIPNKIIQTSEFIKHWCRPTVSYLMRQCGQPWLDLKAACKLISVNLV